MLAISHQQTWTQRDIDILRTLALKVRMLTLKQVANLWWKPSPRRMSNARRRLRLMCDADLLSSYSLNTHPLLNLELPVCAWQPGDRRPSPGKVSYGLRSRWTEPSIPQTVYMATKKSIFLFASYSSGLPSKPFDWTHDLHVAVVYCYYHRHRPEEFPLWIGEDALPKAGFRVKDPDAFIVRSGQAKKVVEFGGRYDKQRCLDFHLHCEDRELPYELW